MPDSLRNLVLGMAILSNDGKNRLPLAPSDYFQAATISVVGNGMVTMNISLFEAEQDDPNFSPVLEELFLAVGVNMQFELQWKVDDGKPLTDAPLYRGNILKSIASFPCGGTRYHLEVAAQEVLPCMLTTPTKYAGFKAGTPVTDIVKTLAQFYGWKTNVTVAGVSKPSIEDAPAVLLMQDEPMVNKSHYQFLTELAGQVTTKKGRPYYFFFDRTGVVHFHSDSYLSRVVQEYNFRNVDGEVMSFEADNESAFVQYAAGANASFIGVDAASGAFITKNATQESGLDSAQINAWGGANYAVEVVEGGVRKAVIVQSRAGLEQRATAAYNHTRNVPFRATATVLGTHDLIPVAFVNVNKYRLNGTLHFVSGTYLLQSVTHQIDLNRWTTSFTGVRQGVIQPGAAIIKTTGAEKLQVGLLQPSAPNGIPADASMITKAVRGVLT